jgi:hypothetical protein
MRRLAAVLVVLAACTGDEREPRPPPAPAPAYLLDAAPAPAPEPAPPAVTDLSPFDPTGGYHLDEDVAPAPVRRPVRAAPRERRTLQLMLKSSPSGAIAAVDGTVVGRTPVYWEGELTGQEREFTFVLPGYSMARYRFVPIQDGFVHGRLQKVSASPPDPEAGPPPAGDPPAR